MRIGKRSHAERVLPFELTPMIDVVFLLIIFFMTTAKFARDTRADVDLPRESGEQLEQSEEAGIIVNIDAAGAIIVSQQTVTVDELASIVRAAIDRSVGRDAEQVKVTLRADRNADSTRLNEVVARLQRMGIGAARFATEVPPGP
jgi:biopolymer transport protein ExbD